MCGRNKIAARGDTAQKVSLPFVEARSLAAEAPELRFLEHHNITTYYARVNFADPAHQSARHSILSLSRIGSG